MDTDTKKKKEKSLWNYRDKQGKREIKTLKKEGKKFIETLRETRKMDMKTLRKKTKTVPTNTKENKEKLK